MSPACQLSRKWKLLAAVKSAMFPLSDQPLEIGLLQISEQFKGHYFLPYTAGVLQAYVQQYAQHPERYQFRPPLFARLSVEAAVTHLKGCHIIGFSVYVWNYRLSVAIAQMIKLMEPQTLIVFGGPQVPDQAEAFLREHPFIDLCSHGEGEATFLQILEAWPNNDWQGLPGVSFLDATGQFYHQPTPPRRKDLSALPSPYLTDCFAPLMQAYPHIQWVASWETNRGCPFSCTFCDWGSAIQSKVYAFPMPMLLAELQWFCDHRIEMIYCCDANFGVLARDEEIAQAVAELKLKTGFPVEFHQQSAKNVTERIYRIHQHLIRAGVITEVTLALQSMSPHTLHSIRRDNISLATYLELHRRLRQEDMPTYTDLILGLPGETYASFADGIELVMAGGQLSRIQFYMAAVLPNAEMAAPEYQQKYGLITTEIPVGPLVHATDIPEYKTIIVATQDMPTQDWIKARALAWMTTLLFFVNKLLPIPLVLLHHLGGVSFRWILEAFLTAESQSYPLLAQINQDFRAKAQAIQQGEGEFCPPLPTPPWKAFQGMWFSPDTFQILKLALNEHLDDFYRESEALILTLCPEELPQSLLTQAVALNQALFQITFMCEPQRPFLPFQAHPIALQLDWNLLGVYQGAVQGKPVELCAEHQCYLKNWAGPPYVLQKV